MQTNISSSSLEEEYQNQIQKRIEDWKCRLIDLSKRNNLIYFKPSKRGTLKVDNPDPKTIFNKLVLRKNQLEFWMPPHERYADETNYQKSEEKDGKEFEAKIEPILANQLVCEGVTKTELEKVLKNLHRRSLSDYRERGVRILYAAFGTLFWRDITTNEEVRSPLVMVPIELDKETFRKPFSISVPQVEEETALNPALQVKLRTDYKIDLPFLPEEWKNDSLFEFFNEVSKAVFDLGWTVEQTVAIGLFSFHKLVIYKDLDSNFEGVSNHPIVRAIAGVKDNKLVLDDLPEEKDVDKIENPEETFQVLDADSSQRVSIDFALKGQSFVMQGPPGTGKSQTIANIIAECIARGKSVLFVSEKMAALEVVYKRLSEVGLANFCLELHSSKANKQQVVAELKRCLDEQLIQGNLPSMHEFEKMKHLREQLNEYVAALHLKQPLLQKSAFEILGMLANLEKAPYVQVGLSNPGSLTPKRMNELEELMSHLKNVWQVVEEEDFPWRGYRGNKYNLEIRAELTTQLEEIMSTLSLLSIEASRYAQRLGIEAPSTLNRINWLIGLSNLLEDSPRPETSWVVHSSIDELISEAQAYKNTMEECQAVQMDLLERFDSSFFNLLLNISAELEKELSSIENFVSPISVREGQLLRKRERLLKLIKNTPLLSQQWKQRTKELNDLFGLAAEEEISPDRVSKLARIATLCFSEEKPEQSWFDPSFFEGTQETLRKAKSTYNEYNVVRERISQQYDDRIYDLDIDGFIKRYSSYQGALKIFSSSYRHDQKEISLLTHGGKVSKTILRDLTDAKKAKSLKAEMNLHSKDFRNYLGHFYKGDETDFDKIEKALEIPREVFKMGISATIPDQLKQIISYPSIPSQEIKQTANELNESLAKWQQMINELEDVIPSHLPNSNLQINETSLVKIEEWTNETARQLIPLHELTNEIMATTKQEIPKNYAELLKDLKKGEAVRRKEAEILNSKELLATKFGSRFSNLETNWNEILSVLYWTKDCQGVFDGTPIPENFAAIVANGAENAPLREELLRLFEVTPKVLASLEHKFETGTLYETKDLRNLELDAIHDRLKELRDRIDDLQTLVDFKETKSQFDLYGLEAFFSRLIDQHPPSSEIVNVFQRGVYQEWINNLYQIDPRLGRFRRENHEELIKEFRKLDQELIKLSANRVIKEANNRKPQEMLIQATDSEVNTLLKEAAKKRRLMPIRTLIQKIPHILPRIKPCMLMSPISVSQFLNSETRKFDLILFDEASQIVPEDAICSIFRGKGVVVAGDNKQLPPTSFFQKSLIDDMDWDEMTDADVEVFDSILDEFLGIGLPVKTLRWHYRSRHEDLIAFSNRYFYDGSLITFPSAEANHSSLGVKFVYVPDAVYDRGGRRDNVKEAEVVADLIFDHFERYPKKTVGVVTFSIAQMEAIEDSIEKRLDQKPDFEKHFREDRLEGFFVKNLENVQGDERDVMIFSVGYGRDQQGLITMNFGPLNKPGGERRLNVAITRAREKTIIVSSIKSSDIDLDAAKTAGITSLFQYLKYAEMGRGIICSNGSQNIIANSAIEENVAEEIRRLDYEITPHVGCSDYKVDIGVIDPANQGHYLLGVECDGSTYLSSNSARDRDRLREQVLNNLGWRIHRVWSPSWVAKKESEVRRLKEALEQICLPKDGEYDKRNADFENEKNTVPSNGVTRKVQLGGVEMIGAPYKVHKLKASFNSYIKVPISKPPYFQTQRNEFHFPANRSQQTRLLAELVENEGPIHFDYAVQRLAEVWEVKRVTVKVTQAVREAANLLIKEHKIVAKGEFLWPANVIETPARVPVINAPESKRPLEQIPPEEIENAMKQITKYSLGIGSEALISETAKVFGFVHCGEKARSIMLGVYEKMLRERKLLKTNDIVTAA